MRLRQRSPAEQVAYYEGVLARERVHLSALVDDAKKRRALSPRSQTRAIPPRDWSPTRAGPGLRKTGANFSR